MMKKNIVKKEPFKGEMKTIYDNVCIERDLYK